MFGPYTSFQSIESSGLYREYVSAVVPSNNREIAVLCRNRGLEVQAQEFIGSYMVLPSRQGTGGLGTLERTPLYSLARREEILLAQEGHINYIAGSYGRGKVWFLNKPAHVVQNDGQNTAYLDYQTHQHYFLIRSFFAHERQLKYEGQNSLLGSSNDRLARLEFEGLEYCL